MWSLVPWSLLLLTVLTGGWLLRERDRRARERHEESERVLREAMLAADVLAREKSELLATVSHEIRNPLNGVIGMTEMLLETRLDDEQQHYAGAVRKSARMLLDLLNDVLDYSKAEAGAIEFEREPTDVRDLAASSVAVFAEPARRKRLDLAAVVDPSVPDRPHLDPLRVGQVLMNLVGNAVKFTEQGEVVLEVGWSDGPGTPGLTARVRDTGVGIAPEQMIKLFQPYQQARASVARIHGGTGLGLAIARRLSEGMGGKLTAHSQPGQGTELVLELPVHAIDRNDPSARSALAGRTVLVVDPGAATRAAVRCALEALGAHAETAVDVADARPSARRLRPDAILVDADLADAAELLGQRPVLLLAGLGVDTQQARARGFAGVLSKPLVPDELRRVLVARLAEAPALLERALRPVVVLVVDGNPVNQVVLVTTLRAMGCTVDVTETMDEADVAMRQRSYDLVLAGTRVPGGDTTLRVSGDPGSPTRPPVIAITRGERSEWTEVGVDARLQWPPRPGELATTLREWVPDAFGTEG